MELSTLFELTIFSVVKSDEGLYRAVIWYIWDEMNSKLIDLAVFETISNVSIHVSMGADEASCQLQCKTAEGTKLTYKWQSHGVEVVNDKHHNISDGGSRLSVAMSVVVPVGHSFYKCTASNAVSSDSIEIDLNPDCSTGNDRFTLPIWAIVVLSIFSLFCSFVLFLCACFFWCRDVRWFLRRRRAWFNPPQAQYPTSSTVGATHTSSRRIELD
ncbi:uncharacterized protein LOC125488062 [Rhincodon typus]|uniref:uncharacterized protein LOC125488062 n=1 Tax=Rhincodon typus TaxID=259920 RepID=UPI0020309332|nr:uncharacterized protein LOC125488062 [Rhincodon typus]